MFETGSAGLFSLRTGSTKTTLEWALNAVADLALSREIWPVETMAFEQVLGYKPSAFEVASGSFDVPTKSDSLEIFVHRDNPISKLTLAQADAIIGSEHLPIWGELGLESIFRRPRAPCAATDPAFIEGTDGPFRVALYAKSRHRRIA